MSLDLDALTKKDKDELIAMIKKQDARIEDLSTKVRRGATEDGDVTEQGGTFNPFDIRPDRALPNLRTLFNSAKDTFLGMADILDMQVVKQLDEAATSIQQNFALSKNRLYEFKVAIADTVPDLIRYGYSEQEAMGVTADIMDGLKTSTVLTAQATKEIGAAAKVTNQDIDELVAGFRGVGISMQRVGKEMKGVTDYARSVGVSVKSISSLVLTDIGKLNLYNFDNGVLGLAKMAAQADRLGVSMRDTFRIAEELFSPENAINLAAGLQRLGVTANGLLDPLRAMDLAQNDPEQLQKEIVNLSKEFTTFNEQTGKMEILPGGKRRLREIANELKIDAGEFAKMSIQAADFDRKLKQIRMPALAEGDEETKELIASMASLDATGIATIQVKDSETGKIKTKDVDQLTDEDIEELKKANEESSKSIEEIAINQLDETKQIKMILRSGELTGKFGRATAPTFDKLGRTMADLYKNTAQGFREQIGSTKDVRDKFEGVAGPVEDLIVGLLQGDVDRAASAEAKFIDGAKSVVDSFLNASEDFVQDLKDATVKTLTENYSKKDKKPESPKELNVNFTITGDPSLTRHISQEMIRDMFIKVTDDPNTKVMVNSNLDGTKDPSAALGGKNK